ncbi:glycerate kinase, partial [Staphylococcus pseudintermedius]|uniref:glycerate kinase n=1 Tax=Staphylococcus pseudintermedius TaxID=283734 RepID=UPI000E39134E
DVITVIGPGQFFNVPLPLVQTSSYGVGVVMRHALDKNAQNMISSVGAIDTFDGGGGMLKGLGEQYYDDEGHTFEMTKGDGQIKHVRHIDLEELHEGLN